MKMKLWNFFSMWRFPIESRLWSGGERKLRRNLFRSKQRIESKKTYEIWSRKSVLTTRCSEFNVPPPPLSLRRRFYYLFWRSRLRQTGRDYTGSRAFQLTDQQDTCQSLGHLERHGEWVQLLKPSGESTKKWTINKNKNLTFIHKTAIWGKHLTKGIFGEAKYLSYVFTRVVFPRSRDIRELARKVPNWWRDTT